MKNVTLRQLRIFEAVARHLSFSRAAEELHLTQPAVSMQVQALEDQAGLPLTEQAGKKVRLTAAGRQGGHAQAHAARRTAAHCARQRHPGRADQAGVVAQPLRDIKGGGRACGAPQEPVGRHQAGRVKLDGRVRPAGPGTQVTVTFFKT